MIVVSLTDFPLDISTTVSRRRQEVVSSIAVSRAVRLDPGLSQ